MKTSILFLFVLTILSSCTTQRKCLRKYPPQTSTVIVYRDSIHTEVKYRDTTIFVKIPGQTITDTIFVPVNSPGPSYVPDTARAENTYSIAKAWLDWPQIRLNLFQKPQTIEILLKNAIKERDTYRELYENEKSKEVQIVKETPKFWKITGTIGMGFLLAVLVWLVMKLKKIVKI